MKLKWKGEHAAIQLWPDPYVNVPLGGHRILVIGWGRLGRGGTWHPYQPCAYFMRLKHCCGRSGE